MSDHSTSGRRPPAASLDISAIRRRGVRVSTESLVRIDAPLATCPMAPVVRPAGNVDLVGWAREHGAPIRSRLLETGVLLFRGFALDGPPAFEAFMRALYGELLEYSYRSTPRSTVTGRIYTSTEYPAHQAIAFHNEMSYSRSWPLAIAFHCIQPAEQGGETPIADSRAVWRRLPASLRARFDRDGVMYVRNFGEHLDLPWQNAFQTQDRGEVSRFCRDAGLSCEWLEGDRLRTRHVCQATAVHPRTGDVVWFNQAHLFHWSNLDPAAREGLFAHGGEAGLPRHAYYGNGDPIDLAVLDEIRAAFEAERQAFTWTHGDILLLDNMRTAHARAPFVGRRQVVVAMADEIGASDAKASTEEAR